jgi:hypothetical protein
MMTLMVYATEYARGNTLDGFVHEWLNKLQHIFFFFLLNINFAQQVFKCDSGSIHAAHGIINN